MNLNANHEAWKAREAIAAAALLPGITPTQIAHDHASYATLIQRMNATPTQQNRSH